MTISDPDAAFAVELFSALPNLTTRKMTGALCLYSDGVIFAVAGEDGIYLKARGSMPDALQAAGSRQFKIERKDGTVGTNGYWTLPEPALDDPQLACDWARRALREL